MFSCQYIFFIIPFFFYQSLFSCHHLIVTYRMYMCVIVCSQHDKNTYKGKKGRHYKALYLFFLLWATSCCCSFFALIIKIKVKYIKRKDIPYNNPHSIHHGIILDFIVCCCVCARHIATMYRAKVMIIYMLYPSHISTKISSWGRKKNST